jgi:predicted O-methyltransferase YrrM
LECKHFKFSNFQSPFWKEAKIDDKINLIFGDALETLEMLSKDEKEVNTFDFAFIE